MNGSELTLSQLRMQQGKGAMTGPKGIQTQNLHLDMVPGYQVPLFFLSY